MTVQIENSRRQAKRIAFWGEAYLDSTQQNIVRAHEFESRSDYFTAYLYLFVAFNNLYCLLARFEGREQEKIRAALENVAGNEIDRFYSPEYAHFISELNDRPTEQFARGPDAGAPAQGIANMRDYFLGKDPLDCAAHVGVVAPAWASADEKRKTVQEVAATLLYTIRNNQFHAVKGPNNLADLFTLQRAYRLLVPVVDALLPMAREEVSRMKRQVSRR